MQLPYTNKSANVLPQTPSQRGGNCVIVLGLVQCRLLCAVLKTKSEQLV